MNASRMHQGLFTLTALFVFVAVGNGAATAGEMTVTWKDGIKLSDGEGTTVKFGGRIYDDWAIFMEDDDYLSNADPIEDGTEFRTTRLYASGVIGGVVEFKSQIDFAKSSNEIKDMYLGLTEIPGTAFGLRVGSFKQPFGLEELTSSKYTTFMERSITSSFAPSRNSGFMLHGAVLDGKGTVAASLYREADSHGKHQADGDYSVAGRFTFRPWTANEGKDFLHLGVAATQRNDGDSVGFDLEPEAHLQPDFGDGIELDVQNWTLLGVEAAAVHGPFSAQGEYVMISTSAIEGMQDASFASFYAQASYFVTGERRAYKSSSATFSRVKPSNPMTAESGKGALELAARFSSADLEDGTYLGGKLDAVTVGANWHVNNNARVMLNWVRSEGELDGQIFS